MKKRLSALMLALVMTFSLASCASPAQSSGGNDQGAGGSASSPVSSQELSDFPVTLIDASSREVTIQAKPERLVSGYYITTSMLIALGQQNKLAGIEAKADTRPIYSLAAAELLELPNVGTAKAFDLEGCAALQPDLVVLPLKLKDSVPALEDLGLTVLLVNPENLEQLNSTIRLLGDATGAKEQALALLDYNQQTQAFLLQTLKEVQRPTVYLAGNSSYLSTAGAKMYQNSLLELGGGQNVAAGLEDDYWADISYEQLLAWNPEVILIASGAAYTRDDILQDPQLSQLAAVQSGRVYAMPSGLESWDSPVPSALVGSRWIAAVLHEDLYAFDAFQSDAKQFYRDFYQIDVGAELLSK